MARLVVYKSERPLTVAGIVRLVELARKAYPELHEPFPATLYCYPSFRGALPPLPPNNRVRLTSLLWITADLDAGRVTPTEVARLLREGTALTTPGGAVRVECTQGEQNPKRPRSRLLHVTAGVARRDGKLWIEFSPGMPPGLDLAAFPNWEDRRQIEEPHRARLFKTAIRAGQLPLRRKFVNDSEGSTFVHTAGGEWESHHWLRHFGEMEFSCTIPGADEEDVAERLEAILTACASPEPCAYQLKIVSGPSPQISPALARLYEGTRTTDWLATRYSLGTAVEIANAAALDVARPLLSKRGVEAFRWLVRLPTTRRESATDALVMLLCKPDSFHVRVRIPASSAGRVPEVERALGVKLTA